MSTHIDSIRNHHMNELLAYLDGSGRRSSSSAGSGTVK